MIQNVISFLAGSNLNKFSQEKWCSLGNGSQFCDVFGLALQAVDLFKSKWAFLLKKNKKWNRSFFAGEACKYY